jgi:NADH:ubiquinone oxidoreductase subunit 6 (subunit J)
MTTQEAVILVVVVGAVIAVARFELFCMRDLAGTRDADLQYLTRTGWFACILLAIPLGGILYLYRGKTR